MRSCVFLKLRTEFRVMEEPFVNFCFLGQNISE